MIINDLEHWESITDKTPVEHSDILGGSAITITLPSINLATFVKAYGIPTQLDLGIVGIVNSGQSSLLKSFSGVFVRAISPL